MDRDEPGENDVFCRKVSTVDRRGPQDPGSPRGTPVHPGRAPAGPRFIPALTRFTPVLGPVQKGLTVGDREDRGEPFVHRASIARFFPSRCSQVNAAAPRSFTVLPGGPTVSTRFNTVHSGRAPLPGPPRFTTVVFDMSKTTGKTPGSSRSTRHHPGPSRSWYWSWY